MLTTGRYVGAEDVEDDGEPFEEKMQRLVDEFIAQEDESERLADAIRAGLSEIGFESGH